MNRVVNQIPDQQIEVDSSVSSSIVGSGGSCSSHKLNVERAALSMKYCNIQSLLPPSAESNILLKPQKQRPRKRRVRFNTTKDGREDAKKSKTPQKPKEIVLGAKQVSEPSSSSLASSSPLTKSSVLGGPLFETLTEDICKELWFQQSEIANIRTTTRNIILFSDPKSEDLAGLERFRNFERSQRKKSANRFVLLAQWKGFDSNFIGKISEECSQWAVTEAALQGFRDFCQVYDPLESLLGPQPPSSPPTTPSPCAHRTSCTSSKSYNESLFGDPVVTTTSTPPAAAALGDEVGLAPPAPPPVMEDAVIGNTFNKIDSMAILIKQRKRKLQQQEQQAAAPCCNSVFLNTIRNGSHYKGGVDPLLGQRSGTSKSRRVTQRQRLSY